MGCKIFDYFCKSTGIFGSKAGEIDVLNKRARQNPTKFSEFSQAVRVGELVRRLTAENAKSAEAVLTGLTGWTGFLN